MANVYIIRDIKCECDCFIFIQENDGAAKHYFSNWAGMQSHTEFQLIRIADIDYVENEYIEGTDKQHSDCYAVTHVARDIIMTGDSLENSNE